MSDDALWRVALGDGKNVTAVGLIQGEADRRGMTPEQSFRYHIAMWISRACPGAFVSHAVPYRGSELVQSVSVASMPDPKALAAALYHAARESRPPLHNPDEIFIWKRGGEFELSWYEITAGSK